MDLISRKNKNISLTQGSIWKGILYFALPIFIGNLFQQMYNVADSLMVGNFLGDGELAAVSSSTPLIQLIISFFDGISIGASVVIARYYGAKKIDTMQKVSHTFIGFGLIMGILMTVIGVTTTPLLLRLMDTPDNILPESITYFKIYFMGSLGFVMYNAFVAIMRSVGDSVRPLIFLIISSIINVFLDYVFVGILHFGVGSAAFATIISQFVSALLCFIYLLKTKDVCRIHLSQIKINISLLGKILKNGIPAGFQGSIISIANVFVQSNINHFGEKAVAGCGAYNKIEGFAFLPIICFSLAMSTFVSQNIGANNYERLKKGTRWAIITCIILAETMGLTIAYFAVPLIGLFTKDPEVIEFGLYRANICGGFFFVLAFSHTISGILRGAGKSYVPMLVMTVCWCLIRVTFISIAVKFVPHISTVIWAYPITWTLSSIIFFIYYKRLNWGKIFNNTIQQ